MTALKRHQHHSHLKVIKSGKAEDIPQKKFSKKSRYYFNKRNNKRKACLEQKNLFFANACVNTLQLIQKAARYLTPAFYYERQVPHYETLRNSISESIEAEDWSINIIEKELCIYKSFSHMNPQRLRNYGKALSAGETEFKIKINEREENYLDKESGLRLIAKDLMLYVTTPQVELFVEINELLLQYKDEKLIQLFYNITIHVNFLNPTKR